MKISRERLVYWSPIVVGALLRLGSLVSNRHFARGDVVVDAAIASSIAAGRGFWVPWENGSAFYPDPWGTTLEEFGHPSDSHGPLWSLLAAPLALVTRSGYAGVQVASWICGILTIVVARALFRRFAEGDAGRRAGEIAAWGCAVSLGLCEYSGNGSLYGCQVLGVLLLPLAAGDLSSSRQAVFAGLLLGLLYLLSYQLALLIPVFTIAAVVNLGIRGSIKPLLTAGACCFGVALPWFIRNELVFGDPLFSTNEAFFKGKVGTVDVDFTGSRPMLRVTDNPLSTEKMFSWVPWNVATVLGLLAVAVPALFWFALGGFERMFRSPRGGRLGASLMLGTLVVLLLTAVVCPQPRTRHFMGMVPILTGAAAVELAVGARLTWALGMAAVSLTAVWYRGFHEYSVVQRDYGLVLPSLLLPLTGIFWKNRARLLTTWAPAAAIAAAAAFGGMRVAGALDLGLNERWYGPPPPSVIPVSTATFYDYLDSPWDDPTILSFHHQIRGATQRLEALDVKILYADVLASPHWSRKLVCSRGRAEWPNSEGIIRFFGIDAVLLPTPYASGESGRAWLERLGAELLFCNAGFSAFRIPANVK